MKPTRYLTPADQAAAPEPAAAPPKAEKIGDFRGVKTYRFGRWTVTVTRTTHSIRASCGLRNKQTLTTWRAVAHARRTVSGYGGIRDAVAALSAATRRP